MILIPSFSFIRHVIVEIKYFYSLLQIYCYFDDVQFSWLKKTNNSSFKVVVLKSRECRHLSSGHFEGNFNPFLLPIQRWVLWKKCMRSLLLLPLLSVLLTIPWEIWCSQISMLQQRCIKMKQNCWLGFHRVPKSQPKDYPGNLLSPTNDVC